MLTNVRKIGRLIATISHDEEPISPVNQYKARAIKKGKFYTAMMYMDPKFDKYKQRFVSSASLQYTGEPVNCHIAIVMETRFGTRRRKDLPNAGKLEFDALNGIIYHDDSQITFYINEKVYDRENPGCVIKVYEDLGSRWEDAS